MLDKDAMTIELNHTVIEYTDKDQMRKDFLELLKSFQKICEDEELNRCVERLFDIL